MSTNVTSMNDVVFERIMDIKGFNTSTGALMWMANQLEDATLSLSSEKNEVVDAMGSKIAEFYKGRSAELSATNALFNLELAAYQGGNAGALERGASGTPITNVPFCETFIVSGTTVVLSHVPTGTAGAEIPEISVINGQGYSTKKYAIASTAGASTFALDAASKTITLPTSLQAGDRVMVDYVASEANAVHMKVNATDIPRACRSVLTVKCHNVCDPSAIVYGKLVLPNSQLSPDYELKFTSDGKHAITLTAMQDYCDPEKRLYDFYLAE